MTRDLPGSWGAMEKVEGLGRCCHVGLHGTELPGALLGTLGE